jgi:pyruvate dehydrogenase (quinone)
VAVLVIPGDVLLTEMDRSAPIATIRPTMPVIRPSDIELDAAADALNSARRVTILAGAGCAGARSEVLALAETLQAPIVHALRGKEIIEYDNPYDVGMTGLLGFSSGYHAMERMRHLLMLGTDFPYREFYPARRHRAPSRSAR